MCTYFKFKILHHQSGITLIEVIVVIFIISIFASIAFLNLPKIQGSFALTGAAYELAQNIRTQENSALSGVSGTTYSVTINASNPKQYTSGGVTITVDKNNPGISIKEIDGVNNGMTNKITDPVNINFVSPNPLINIINNTTSTNIIGNEVDIVLSMDTDSSQTKTVIVNTSGLIQVK